jgi:carbon-monoxide dehydrogenase small subunit
MMSAETEIRFKLNGRDVGLKVPVAMKTLAMLRDLLGMTGTKYACGEGECGACTVSIDGKTVNSCLMYAVDCDGREVVTIEGLRTPEAMHPVQQAFVDHGAVQCGFCMPGMIMQANHLIDEQPQPDARRGTTRPRREPVPLHRLHEGAGRGRGRRRKNQCCGGR